jgi:hypothetical protein
VPEEWLAAGEHKQLERLVDRLAVRRTAARRLVEDTMGDARWFPQAVAVAASY